MLNTISMASEQVQSMAEPVDHTVGYVAAGAALGMSGLLVWMQRSRSLRATETKFSRSLLTLVGMLVLSGLAALALLPTQPELFVGFIGTVAGYLVGRNQAASGSPDPLDPATAATAATTDPPTG